MGEGPMTSDQRRAQTRPGCHRGTRTTSAVLAAVIALCVLPAASGCTRTSDGTIEPIVPLTLDAMPPLRPVGWSRNAPAQPTTLSANQFPDAPAAPQRRGVSGKRLARAAPAVPRFGIATKPILRPASEQPAKAITCREETGSSGKKRVVCD